MNSALAPEIYHGIRGSRFKHLIRETLSLGRFKDPYYSVLLDDIGMEMYDIAFTHKTANAEKNYEWLEFLGDTTLNKSIAWYLPQRFPQLSCTAGVKVLTRLKINLISKKSFAVFGKTLKFWDFISADMDIRNNKMDKTLEDVFEAFFGATELILDTRIRHGIGYEVCYTIVKSLLDDTSLSLQYNDLFDAKTRIKEIIDYFGDEIGELKYVTRKKDRLHHVDLYQSVPKPKPKPIQELLSWSMTDRAILRQLREQYSNKPTVKSDILIGSGCAALKADAQQRASEKGIEYLNKKGFIKELSEDYKRFCS